MIIFFFSLSHPFPSYFALKFSHSSIVLYFEFFFIFLKFCISSRLERNRMITFIFTHSRPFPTNLGSKRSHNGVSFNFLNFFSIFFEFSMSRRIGTERNYNFYFLPFSSFSVLLWLEMKP